MTEFTSPSSFQPLSGGCKCGKTRFRLESEPIIVNCCHCRDCQRVSGSAFRINAMIEADRVTLLQGRLVAFHGPACHPAVQCPECRSTLWSFHPRLGDAIAFVGVGMLDEGERLPPEAHFFTRSKHPWITLPPGLPCFDELARPPKARAGDRIARALAKAGKPLPV
jgi:hypothetical protein